MMRTGPVRDAQQMKQCVYSIPCDCANVIKEHKYNLTQGLLEKSKLAQHAYQEDHKICCDEAKVLQIESDIYREHKESAHIPLIDHPIN
jgi:hypothetical protein